METEKEYTEVLLSPAPMIEIDVQPIEEQIHFENIDSPLEREPIQIEITDVIWKRPSKTNQSTDLNEEIHIKVENEEGDWFECPRCNMSVISYIFDEHVANCGLCDSKTHIITNQFTNEYNNDNGEKPETGIFINNYENVDFDTICYCCLEPLHYKHMVGDFSCILCNKLFIQNASLVIHERIVHNTGTEELVCTRCNEHFSLTDSLIQHMKNEHFVKQEFSCEVCGKAFSKKCNLDRHKSASGCDGRHRMSNEMDSSGIRKKRRKYNNHFTRKKYHGTKYLLRWHAEQKKLKDSSPTSPSIITKNKKVYKNSTELSSDANIINEIKQEDIKDNDTSETLTNTESSMMDRKTRFRIKEEIDSANYKRSSTSIIKQDEIKALNNLISLREMKISPLQQKLMLEFVEKNPSLAIGRCGPNGRVDHFKKWEELATILNSEPSGPQKTAEKWQRVWSSWKNKTRKKQCEIENSKNKKVCGKKIFLKPFEQRLLTLMNLNNDSFMETNPSGETSPLSEDSAFIYADNKFKSGSSKSTATEINPQTVPNIFHDPYQMKSEDIDDSDGPILPKKRRVQESSYMTEKIATLQGTLNTVVRKIEESNSRIASAMERMVAAVEKIAEAIINKK